MPRTATQPDTVRFALGQCSLGAVLVAAGPRGVVAITLADDHAPLIRELEEQHPGASVHADDRDLNSHLAAVIAYIEEPKTGLKLPLDPQGTSFQRRVWRALEEVPMGSTRTYAELAAAIGAPTSARAVAGACAANKIALAIPCHRIIRQDGGLSGYRWGVERKSALLKRESVA